MANADTPIDPARPIYITLNSRPEPEPSKSSFLAVLPVLALAVAGRGWIVWLAWRWWVVDLGAPPLPYGHATAITTLALALIPKPDLDSLTPERIAKRVASWWAITLATLFILGLVVR